MIETLEETLQRMAQEDGAFRTDGAGFARVRCGGGYRILRKPLDLTGEED